MQKNRLSRIDHARLLKGARALRVHGKFFSLATTPLLGTGVAKYTCAVSTKVSKKAVEGNRIKRLCREAVRMHIAEAAEPLAHIFYAKREAVGTSYEEITRDIAGLMKKSRDVPQRSSLA